MTKHWVAQALRWLAQSLEPVPHELNELDWKASLTGNKERLIEHLIAFANHPNGGLPPVVFTPMENAFKVTLYAPKKFDDMTQSDRIEACYQHAVLQYLSSQTVTNTTARKRFKLHDKKRTAVSNLLAEAAEQGRIKRKNPDATSSKFVEYVPYWA